MNGTSSPTCFFSFGPEDSFISKSYEGLRYHALPPALLALMTGGSVLDVHWASLGTITDSWILSFKDSSGTQNLAWGASIPSRLEKVLSKLSPSQHLRVFLGPSSSYIAWDPTLIRWSSLPASLEDTLQSWLTPSGWRAGAPRMVTWGPDDAFFAMSEYGDVAYRLGDKKREDWATWRETVEDWKAERGFRWSEVAYIALDPTTPDQFVAIRNDGTWSGSISDENSTALEAFAHNVFRLAKPKSKTKSPPPRAHQQTNGHTNGAIAPEDDRPDPATKAAYAQWSNSTNLLFASALAATTPKRAPKKLQIRSQSSTASIPKSSTASPSQPRPTPHSNPSTSVPHANLLTSFPIFPIRHAMPSPNLRPPKGDPAGLRACKHDMERLLRASGITGTSG
ncbi:Phosphatidylglycerol/phosphatidylinositol transfer protein [Didymosphaeria variabile]|uniref:Phosphatidylglycerol/phosphatidylinositol transfer protein n=1 Tax=Didymosphaeria variabile TaxID=1932322 RepID=A0A9W8XV98_9PLEO|nr:Phosphatidylglycerol/phosphatidylinositol transfer protein [Didymosphaeria variabile]KAJ4359911.1 Phosphatidylglycerol/phosphatidylinositol transfer protein [Didymosphaeria variabile]